MIIGRKTINNYILEFSSGLVIRLTETEFKELKDKIITQYREYDD